MPMATEKLSDYERRLDKRKAKLGLSDRDFVRPNSGVARTREKRALLRVLDQVARAKGGRPPFSYK